MIHCVAFIGKQNEPIFIHSNAEAVDALHFHFICHSALDLLEERKGKRTATAAADLFLGQLSPMEDYRIFGYITNTNTKLVAICSDLALEVVMRDVMKELHRVFVRAAQNPFQVLGAPITSQKFQTNVANIVKSHNERAALQPFA